MSPTINNSDICFREAIASDDNFIKRCFLSSYKHSHSAGLISMETWAEVMSKEWDSILARPDSRVTVVTVPGEAADDKCDILGYAVTLDGYKDNLTKQPLPYVVFLYVKSNFREFGIESQLLLAAGVDIKQPLHFAVKTPTLQKFYSSLPAARWMPLGVRFPPAGWTIRK